MIRATNNNALDNTRLSDAIIRLANVISRQNEHRAYGSLPETISNYAKKLSTELRYNPSRSRYLDLHIRRNELAESNMTPATNAEAELETSSFKLFQDLFSYLDELVQIRKEMTPTKGAKPFGTSRLVLDEKRPEFDKAIIYLGSAIAVFLESLSNQSRDFVETYVKNNAQLVHQFMNAPLPASAHKYDAVDLPESHIKFRHLLGLDRNQDGSKRERIKRTAKTHNKKAPQKEPEVTAEHVEGSTYKITIRRLGVTFHAEKTSKIFPDRSAKFRPFDPSMRASISRLKPGQDWVAAFIKE